jgi:hypothetical protein
VGATVGCARFSRGLLDLSITVLFSALLRLLGGCPPPDTSSPISHDAQYTLSTPASISPDAHCFSYLHSAHRRRSLAALICTDVHRFSTKMSALCTGDDDDDDDDQISSYFLPGKTLSEYLVNGNILLHF